MIIMFNFLVWKFPNYPDYLKKENDGFLLFEDGSKMEIQ